MKTKDTTIQIRLTSSEKERLHQMAKLRCCTMTEILKESISHPIEYPNWFTKMLIENRDRIEIIYDIEDARNTPMEQIIFEAEEHRKKIERDKDLILYNYLGNRIIMRQPFKD